MGKPFVGFSGKLVSSDMCFPLCPFIFFMSFGRLSPLPSIFIFFSFLWGDTDTHRVFIDSTIPHFCFLEEEGGLGIKSFCDLVEALEQKVW